MKRKIFIVLILVFISLMALSSNAEGVDIGPFVICDYDDFADGISPLTAIDEVFIEDSVLKVVMALKVLLIQT